MNDDDEIAGLGRRQGALWAIETIRTVIRNGHDLPEHVRPEHAEGYHAALANLAGCGVDPVGQAIFIKAADDEMGRRYTAFFKVIVP